MSASASQAAKFYREVAKNRVLWTVRDESGFPAPLNSSGKRAQPFWSSLSHVQKIISRIPAYGGFTPFEISWADFESRWIPGLARDGILAGINWSGVSATGYDVEPEHVRAAVEALIQ